MARAAGPARCWLITLQRCRDRLHEAHPMRGMSGPTMVCARFSPPTRSADRTGAAPPPAGSSREGVGFEQPGEATRQNRYAGARSSSPAADPQGSTHSPNTPDARPMCATIPVMPVPAQMIISGRYVPPPDRRRRRNPAGPRRRQDQAVVKYGVPPLQGASCAFCVVRPELSARQKDRGACGVAGPDGAEFGRKQREDV